MQLFCYSILFILEFKLIQFINGYPGVNTRKDWDICSHWNGRRHFLELGERGELHARNVSASNYRSSFYSPPVTNTGNITVPTENWYQCNLELVTCSECVIRITFTYANFSKTCQQPISSTSSIFTNKCPCEHITFSEPPYDISLSGQILCGYEKVYRSKTRTILMNFYFRATYSHVFSLQYFSERNVNVISGSPKRSLTNNFVNSSKQIISTPYFPIPYPRDYGIEHILTCESDDCHIKLEFTDFQLGMISSMMVFDSNGQMLDSYNGDIFRPPIILSTGKSLLLQFRGNGVTAIGYKAEISFISDSEYNDKSILPNTDCGGMVEGLGGAITMMNMIENETEIKYYDCIWIIKPANNYIMMKTHISLRLDTFLGMESISTVDVRQGITSTALLVESANWPNTKINDKNHITQILTGFYIHLKGVFGKYSRLAIVYSVFNYMNCYMGSEFLCENNRCLSIRLHCDGFDHCGDGSDEPESCEQQRSSIQSEQRDWYANKPNYYFPKIEQYPDLKTATGIFVMSTLGILIVLSGWMMILYRMGVRARHQRELQNQLQTISELLDRDRQDDQPDNPPDYEAPPDYEEVVKFGIGNEAPTKRGNPQRNRKRLRKINRDQRNLENRPHNGENHVSVSNENSRIPAENSNGRPEQLQSLASQIINSTGMCEPSNSSASWEKCENENPDTTVPLLSNNGVNTNQNFQSTSAYSSGTSTQFEEHSSAFRDESLDISFSLAVPNSSLKPGQNRQDLLYYDNQHLKKAWVIFENGQVQTLQNKRIRLRHTYSSPETFLRQLCKSDDMNYGNIYSERDSYLSNASTFGSDLSPDPVPSNSTTISNNNLKKDEENQFLKPGQSKSKNTPYQQTSSQQNNDQQSSITSSNSCNSSHTDPDISCFNLFVNNNKKEIHRLKPKKRGHRRSSSYTNCERRRQNEENVILKRCSSVDLLVRASSPYQFRTSSPPFV